MLIRGIFAEKFSGASNDVPISSGTNVRKLWTIVRGVEECIVNGGAQCFRGCDCPEGKMETIIGVVEKS